MWVFAIIFWVGFIFFSSTSLARIESENAFAFFSGALFGPAPDQTTQHQVLHLLADKGFHVTMFCILALLLFKAIPERSHNRWIILLAGAVVGSCSELLQRLFPDRDPALTDVFINICGTALGIALWTALQKWQRRTHPLASI
jgi:VanZ family protein